MYSVPWGSGAVRLDSNASIEYSERSATYLVRGAFVAQDVATNQAAVQIVLQLGEALAHKQPNTTRPFVTAWKLTKLMVDSPRTVSTNDIAVLRTTDAEIGAVDFTYPITNMGKAQGTLGTWAPFMIRGTEVLEKEWSTEDHSNMVVLSEPRTTLPIQLIYAKDGSLVLFDSSSRQPTVFVEWQAVVTSGN